MRCDVNELRVIVCLDGIRRVLAERDGSVTVYSLYEPASLGRFASVRKVDGALMGRADTRRPDDAGPMDYDEALDFEMGQRRRAEDQIIANCPELRALDQRGGLLGVFRARGRVRFIGSAERSTHLARAQRRQGSRAASQTQHSAGRAAL